MKYEAASMKIEVVRSFKMSVNYYQTRRRHIPEDSALHYHREELKSQKKNQKSLCIYTTNEKTASVLIFVNTFLILT
jgi:hypothetical protein